MNIVLHIILLVAPTIQENKVNFSLFNAANILGPVILAIEIINTIGVITCIGIIAGIYSFPLNNNVIGFANKNKPTVIGIDNKVMILTVLLVNILKLFILEKQYEHDKKENYINPEATRRDMWR